MTSFEIILHNVGVYNPHKPAIRLVLFEIVNGCRSVREILEAEVVDGSLPGYALRVFGDMLDLAESDTKSEIVLLNENVDLGRAKRWSAKVKKIAETLVAEGRDH